MKEEAENVNISQRYWPKGQVMETIQVNIGQFPIIEVNPVRCKPWKYHNRDSAWFTVTRCRDLINSIKTSGQIDPALVRKIDDPNYDYEIIYGMRRCYACSKIPNQRLLARVTAADDKVCMILMHTENANSKDITEFERAYSFSQQMKSGAFKNQMEMAEVMGVSQGTISKMLKAASIFEYDWIRKLFPDKLEIPIKRACALSVLLKKSKYFTSIKQEAEHILEKQKQTPNFLTSPEILKQLIRNTREVVSINKNSILLTVNEKPVVSCHQDKLGKLSIVIEKQAKCFDRAAIEQACLKAINDYLSQNTIPLE